MPHSSGKSPLTANQRFLLGASFLLGILAVACFQILRKQPDGLTPAIGVTTTLSVLAVIPLVLVRRGRRHGRRGSMSHLVRSSNYSGNGFTDVEITSDQPLPRVCIRCGEATTRVSPFRFHGMSMKASPYDWSRANPLFLVLIAIKSAAQKVWELTGSHLVRRKAAGEIVVFKIPHCKNCAAGNPVVQRHFDFHGRRMIVEAHPEFRARFRKLPKG